MKGFDSLMSMTPRSSFSQKNSLKIPLLFNAGVAAFLSKTPTATGGREVKSRLNSIRYIWSIITWPDQPQNSWYLHNIIDTVFFLTASADTLIM